MSIAIYDATRNYRRIGHADLRNQLTRSASSMASNIVEGAGSSTNEDFARFLDHSIKSANETEGHLLTARDLRLMSEELWKRFTDETVEIRKMTYSYRNKVRASAKDKRKRRD